MKKLLSLLLLITSSALAQVQTTPNLITNNTWTGPVQSTTTGGGVSGGNVPAYNPNTNTIYFGYVQNTVAQSIAINTALSGTGIRIGGIQYGATYYNEQMASGTLSATATITNNSGAVLNSYNHTLAPTTNGWTAWSESQTFANQYTLANVGNATLSFTGKDNRFWAGYYGPMVKDPYLKLTYSVDHCATNPAYSPSCPNYNTVSVSNNLLPGTTGAQAYAINQALASAGAGATIHGFDYGYSYNVSGRTCGFLDLFGFCLTGWNYSDAGVATVITDSNNNNLFSETTTHNGGNTGVSGNYSKQFRLGSSLPMSALGAFAMAPWINGTATITNMYSSAVYTADPCSTNPLHAPSCPGYAAAYFTQQCSSNPLYDSQCPGYAQAYFNQQCSASALYNQACPGYAAAYLSQQCSLNPLYATQCPGYATAYKAQQCSLNALYATDCPGYEQAYFTQQCNLNGLYSTNCPNYAAAYAKKNLLEQQNTTTTTTATSPNQVAQVSKTEATPSISSDGTVKAEVSKTGDSNVDKAIESPSPSTNSSAAPAAPVQLSQPNNNQQPVAAAAVERRQERQEKQEEKKDASGAGPSSSSNNQTASSQETKPSGDQPKTARQELQERRVEAARAKAVEEGKNLAGNIGKAASLEQQVAVQNVVIQAMGYTPGFDAYNKAMIPDGVGYKPFTVYNNQRNVDNARLGRGLFGPTDRLHDQMVSSQYERKN